jgi:hypothetical protein
MTPFTELQIEAANATGDYLNKRLPASADILITLRNIPSHDIVELGEKNNLMIDLPEYKGNGYYIATMPHPTYPNVSIRLQTKKYKVV